MTTGGAALLERARSLGPRIRTFSDEAESLRRLPREVVTVLAEAGFFKLGLPEQYGGAEVDPVTFIEIVDELSRHDCGRGVVLMIASTTAPMAAYLPERTPKRSTGGDPLTVTGGASRPAASGARRRGRLRRLGSMAVGERHAALLSGSAAARSTDAGDFRLMFFPATDVEILDTWHSSGLRGTGSTDFTVTSCSSRRAGRWRSPGRAPRLDRPLYRLPAVLFAVLAVASVCLGIARRAIDEVVDLAEAKTPVFTSRRLAKSTMAQVDVAKAEAALASARAFLLDEVATTWADVLAGRDVAIEQRARIRLAATNAGRALRGGGRPAYNTGGGSSVYSSSPLQRCFRDIHTATQHLMVSPRAYEIFGRQRLGLPLDGAMI